MILRIILNAPPTLHTTLFRYCRPRKNHPTEESGIVIDILEQKAKGKVFWVKNLIECQRVTFSFFPSTTRTPLIAARRERAKKENKKNKNSPRRKPVK